jgi:hypothetical protein
MRQLAHEFYGTLQSPSSVEIGLVRKGIVRRHAPKFFSASEVSTLLEVVSQFTCDYVQLVDKQLRKPSADSPVQRCPPARRLPQI